MYGVKAHGPQQTDAYQQADSSPQTDAGPTSAKAGLRGMSFAEQSAALSPYQAPFPTKAAGVSTAQRETKGPKKRDPRTHIVAQEETLYSLVEKYPKRFKSVRDIVDLNPQLQNLQVGQTLRIPDRAGKIIEYVTVAEDTYSSIARDYPHLDGWIDVMARNIPIGTRITVRLPSPKVQPAPTPEPEPNPPTPVPVKDEEQEDEKDKGDKEDKEDKAADPKKEGILKGTTTPYADPVQSARDRKNGVPPGPKPKNKINWGLSVDREGNVFGSGTWTESLPMIPPMFIVPGIGFQLGGSFTASLAAGGDANAEDYNGKVKADVAGKVALELFAGIPGLSVYGSGSAAAVASTWIGYSETNGLDWSVLKGGLTLNTAIGIRAFKFFSAEYPVQKLELLKWSIVDNGTLTMTFEKTEEFKKLENWFSEQVKNAKTALASNSAGVMATVVEIMGQSVSLAEKKQQVDDLLELIPDGLDGGEAGGWLDDLSFRFPTLNTEAVGQTILNSLSGLFR